MNESDSSFPNNAKRPIGWIVYLILIASFIGFLDAGYLTYSFYSGQALKCTILASCNVVTSSSYSKVLGLPLSVYGAVFYLTVFGLALIVLDRSRFSFLTLIFYLAAGAVLVSLYLVYLQAFVLKAWCFYCVVSAALSAVIFISAWLGMRKGLTGATV
ncbi:MAG: vitamin K epoxide reductase family protein [Candidatus Doudnabacteria bacterium]|nr:vitamin K epoxide reductase family protein [Candidatus Doudnabacteria bacterium]